jgi:hypothetical protein
LPEGKKMNKEVSISNEELQERLELLERLEKAEKETA